MRPRGSRSDTDHVREAIQDAIQQRVHALEFAGDDKISHENNLICSSLREDVVSVACRVLDHAVELDSVAAQLGNQATHDLVATTPSNVHEDALAPSIRLTQHLKAPLPPAARGGIKVSAAKASTSMSSKLKRN
ncbi:hypothetical protein DYB25_002766 [Aphanomyces astaci]|uniref:Uncharacterized protein n=1 Tax=Aphanomyces astaci TaxID=112090 RepID=A0A397B7N6_APHAT|nr:hypothetical protein DYB25_002766 [Aphanomyces astaci]RHY15251.1 hypothetical protein DYB36_011064 [Aphanomyces astaci]RHY44028.1 hypothetical protein DYB34_004169 [Aphanomyces astaci]RHY58663.1 hypothetical protein DYB30_003717 [Aphanomyces astaci]RHY78283.1 hypothetical protein DYB38_004816 [Aphanomyces astaci]